MTFTKAIACVVLVGALVAGALWLTLRAPFPETVNDAAYAGERTYEERVGTYFLPAPLVPDRTALSVVEIVIPAFEDDDSIWGATGRDDRGHIWFGVSSHGNRRSAHLYEYNPETGEVHGRGDVLSQLERAGIYRTGEGQVKIHSKIVQADDGYLYFSSMDEEEESAKANRLPKWGSHLWRLRPGEDAWEHLLSAPEALIAVGGVGRWVYALGYWDHVVYQYDTSTGSVRSARVGSTGGHVSRNVLTDRRGHAFVPRVSTSAQNEEISATLVELDTALQFVAETPLYEYLGPRLGRSHGVIGVSYMEDGTIVFATHVGYLYKVVPWPDGPASVVPLGWFHPGGRAYTPSLFTYAGQRYLVGVARAPGKPFEWVVYDLKERNSFALPLATDGMRGLLLYGSITRDPQGRFYIAGRRADPEGGRRPVLLQVTHR